MGAYHSERLARLPELTTKPTSRANTGAVYCKDAAGVTELFFENDAGTESQLTGLGGTIGGSGANTRVTFWSGPATLSSSANWTYNSTTSAMAFTQAVNTSGSPVAWTLTGGAHTTLAASTEASDVRFALDRTVQFAQGALTTQRAVVIAPPTYAFATGASTLTNAATLAVTGQPVAGTNATITNSYATWFMNSTALTNVTSHVMRLEHATSGTAAANIGVGMEHWIENASGTAVNAAAFRTVLTTATNGSETAVFRIGLMSAGSAVPSEGSEQHRFLPAQYLAPDGTASLPGMAFTADTDVGIYRVGANNIGIAMNGSQYLAISTTFATWAGGGGSTPVLKMGASTIASPAFTVASDTDTGIHGPQGDILSVATGGLAALTCNPHSIASAAGATADTVSVPAQTLTITGSTNITTTTGFNLVNIGIATLSAASALTVTNSASLYIAGAPAGGGAGPATITNAYSLWVDAGNVRFDGSTILSSAALATNATDGFVYIPTCAGTPTGTPTTQTGTVALVYDTTNNKMYVYNTAWKGGTTPGAWV